MIMALLITSTAFRNGERIPRKHTCDGDDVSPPLLWSGAPEGTKSHVLITDDPDCPTGVFTHWVLYNLPAKANGLPEGVPKQKVLENGGLQGINDFGEAGYGGPCPPRGKPHRYQFHIYALDSNLNLEAGASKHDVLKAMQGHVLADGGITGVYGR